MAVNGLLQDGNRLLAPGCGEPPELCQRARDKIPGIEIIDRSRFGTHTFGR
jgi:hypothetical protein